MNSNPQFQPPTSLYSMIPFLNRACKITVSMCAAALLGLASSGHAQNVSDFGATAPTAGPNDIFSQLTTGGTDLGGTWYVDSGNPGQSFTTLSDRSTYPLTSVYIHMRSTGGSASPIPLNTYALRIYTMTNTTAVGGTATVLTTYTTTNSTTLVQGDWVKISGLTNILSAGTNYGFALSRITTGYWEPDFTSSSVYAGGAAVRFKTTTGTLNTVNTANDMVFLLGLSMSVAPTTFSPISPVWTNAPVTLSAPFTGGAGPFTYDWQVSTDQGVTYSDLGAGNGSPTYSLNPANLGGTTNYYRLIVSDGESTP